MSVILKKYLFLLFVWGFVSLHAQEQSLFDQATQNYAEQNYEEAVKNYQGILDQGKASVEVYFNLGNAYYKLDKLGPSIFYYNKALQLNPNDSDVQNNLLFAQEKTVDVIEESPKTGLANFIDSLISIFSFDTWAVWAIIFAFGLLVFGVLYYFAVKAGWKRLFFSLAVIAVVAGALSIVFAYQQQVIQQSKKYAIIYESEVEVHTEPNHNSPEAFRLHEGTKVKILDTFNGYAQIKLIDDSRGWVKQEAINEL